jgi:hypothetical protein
MKAKISGVTYSTKRARLIGSYDNLGNDPDCPDDFGNFWARLMVTPFSNRHFLHGGGGAMTRFARPTADNQLQAGERIIPLTRHEAYEWAQRYLDPETVNRWFGDLIGGGVPPVDVCV